MLLLLLRNLHWGTMGLTTNKQLSISTAAGCGLMKIDQGFLLLFYDATRQM